MTIAVGDVVRMSMEGRAAGQQIINTYHWRCSAVGSSTVDNAVIPGITSIIIKRYQTNVLDFLSSEYRILQGMGQRLFPTISAVYINPPDPADNQIGQRGLEALPNMNSMIFTVKTGLPGRSRRGRTYYSPLDETTVGYNLVDGILRPIWESQVKLMLQLIIDIVWGTWEFGVFSSLPTVVPRFAPWLEAQSVLRPLIGTQRRRRVGVGA